MIEAFLFIENQINLTTLTLQSFLRNNTGLDYDKFKNDNL